MGKKKKDTGTAPQKMPAQFWCYYCDTRCEDEYKLVQHQRSKHFLCRFCDSNAYGRNCLSLGGLVSHVRRSHKKEIKEVPGAIEGRTSLFVEVSGMNNIPEEALLDFQEKLAEEMKAIGLNQPAPARQETAPQVVPPLDQGPPEPAEPPPLPEESPPMPGGGMGNQHSPLLPQFKEMAARMAQQLQDVTGSVLRQNARQKVEPQEPWTAPQPSAPQAFDPSILASRIAAAKLAEEQEEAREAIAKAEEEVRQKLALARKDERRDEPRADDRRADDRRDDDRRTSTSGTGKTMADFHGGSEIVPADTGRSRRAEQRDRDVDAGQRSRRERSRHKHRSEKRSPKRGDWLHEVDEPGKKNQKGSLKFRPRSMNRSPPRDGRAEPAPRDARRDERAAPARDDRDDRRGDRARDDRHGGRDERAPRGEEIVEYEERGRRRRRRGEAEEIEEEDVFEGGAAHAGRRNRHRRRGEEAEEVDEEEGGGRERRRRRRGEAEEAEEGEEDEEGGGRRHRGRRRRRRAEEEEEEDEEEEPEAKKSRKSKWDDTKEEEMVAIMPREPLPMVEQIGTKREMCMAFTEGLCTRGEQCLCAHSLRELAPGGFKPRLCPSFMRGGCPREQVCPYAHKREDLPPNFKTTICTNFFHGHCRKQQICNNAHGGDEQAWFLKFIKGVDPDEVVTGTAAPTNATWGNMFPEQQLEIVRPAGAAYEGHAFGVGMADNVMAAAQLQLEAGVAVPNQFAMPMGIAITNGPDGLAMPKRNMTPYRPSSTPKINMASNPAVKAGAMSNLTMNAIGAMGMSKSPGPLAVGPLAVGLITPNLSGPPGGAFAKGGMPDMSLPANLFKAAAALAKAKSMGDFAEVLG